MKFAIRRSSATLFGLALLLLPGLALAQHYQQTNLIGNPNPTQPPPGGNPVKTEPHLFNPWGLTRSSNSTWWVADNHAGVSTLFDGNDGSISKLVVTIPPSGSNPTGTVFNGTPDFPVGIAVTGPNAGKPVPGVFFFATENGTIAGWNPTVDPTNAIQVVGPKKNAIYKGLTLAEANGQHYLYAANFHSGKIEVYDTKFTQVKFFGDAFEDDRVPKGYGPFNVQAVGRNIVVAWAKQDDDKEDEVRGAGLGFVDVFSTTGQLLLRLEHGPWLNAPWGIALAPGDFGEFSHSLLIGQNGGGNIAAFSPFTGHFRGNILHEDGASFSIPGLWAIAFGNNNGTLSGNPPVPPGAGPFNTLFFNAGPNDENDGLFGTLTPVITELNEEDEP
ncbi:MAG TPA: TIGR03118 family protein [Terriglobales bacterium]|nr:TIGR03118 family protein [Terriglobales bacterium]